MRQQDRSPKIWGNSNRYKVAHLTKYGQSLVSLWPLYRFLNTTALLFTRHQDTETGQEEEKEDMNNGRAIFFQIRYLNTRANLCGEYFYLVSIKDDNRSVTMRLNCAITFLFFILIGLEAFCVTQDRTPKMVKNVLLY